MHTTRYTAVSNHPSRVAGGRLAARVLLCLISACPNFSGAQQASPAAEYANQYSLHQPARPAGAGPKEAGVLAAAVGRNGADPDLPDLVLTSLTAQTSVAPGAQVPVSVVVANQGTAPAGAFWVDYYLSPTPTLSGGSVNTNWGCQVTGLPATASVPCNGPITIPSVAPGTWYLIGVADAEALITESNEGNNVRAADSGAITVTGPSETVDTPSAPAGPATGAAAAAHSFSTGGATSNLGHAVQYQFDWGDGTTSPWLAAGATSTSHNWVAGTYSVKARARCATHTAVAGALSAGSEIVVSGSGGTPQDFDGNGVPDLLLQTDSTRSVSLLRLDGPNATTVLGTVVLAAGSYPGWRLAGVADMDGNGALDLVWQNDSTRSVGTWYMNPDRTTVLSVDFQAPGSYPGWMLVGVADMDSNGVPDLVWQNDSTRSVGTWYLNGPKALQTLSVEYQAPGSYPGWRVVGVADIDRNGVPDLVWQNDATRSAGTWYMSGPKATALSSVDFQAPDSYPGWRVVGVADMDRNGVPDLVWQNDSTRSVGTWYMNGPMGTERSNVAFQIPGSLPGQKVAGVK